MTPNQHWRSNLLKAVYLDGPQPIELDFFHRKTSDIDSKKWLSENGLEHYFEDRDITAYRKTNQAYWGKKKILRFIWIAESQFEPDYELPRLQLI